MAKDSFTFFLSALCAFQLFFCLIALAATPSETLGGGEASPCCSVPVLAGKAFSDVLGYLVLAVGPSQAPLRCEEGSFRS